jgi:crotonobetainyl-CoA:carnitine CoA-transferase CaiB-like acyl-CoA transferase
MASGVVPQRLGNGHPNLAPYQSFPTSDGDLIVAVGNDRQFAKLCAVLDVPALADDARFATNPARVANRAALLPLLVARTVLWRAADLLAALEAAGVPVGPVNRIDQVFADPQVVARGMQLAMAGVPGLASPIRYDGERAVAARPSPRLGEHAGAAWL